MSNQQITPRYYPQLSQLLNSDNLPQFVQDLINEHLSKFYYRNFQFSKSNSGESAFYSLDLISKEQISIEIIENLLLRSRSHLASDL